MYDRNLLPVILNDFNKHEIVFLLGTRQTGKTTLTKLVADKSIFNNEDTFFFDFEDRANRLLFTDPTINGLKNTLKIEGLSLEREQLIIFDEIQLLNDPSNLLKLLHDHFQNFKVIATGSSSLQIKSKFSDSLSGRKRVYKVEPLCFDEFLTFKEELKLLNLRKIFKEETDKASLANIISSYTDDALQLFQEYLVYGGYPEVVLSDSKEDKINKLDSIATSYIQKDIREFANIENLDAYNNLLKYLAVNSGAQFNMSSARDAVGISTTTLNKYINLLKETFIVEELPPFFMNKNNEISKNKKIYYKDTGIYNLQLKNYNVMSLRSDAKSLYENHVFNALENNPSILLSNYFYRTQSKSEIDFISINENKISLIEVKSGNARKISRPMTEFCKKYEKRLEIKEMLLINQRHYEERDGVTFMPAFLF